jgi:uncharacterized cupredoxin-like copper-binding protein
MRRTSAVVLPLLSLVLALAACSSGGAASPSAAGPQGGGGGGGGNLDVTLTEFKIDAPSSASAGSVTFNIKNAGTIAHEFIVVKTDTSAASLPTKDSAANLEGMTVAGQEKSIDPGKSATLTVDLQPGHYVLLCNVPGHYPAGMHLDFEVK